MSRTVSPVSSVLSDSFYQAALDFTVPFTLSDIAPRANAERRLAAQRWLAERVERGELKRTRTRSGSFFEWVNT